MHLCLPHAHVVAVSLDEARDGKPSLKVDDARVAPDVGVDRVGAADGQEGIVRGRQGLHLFVVVVERSDGSVRQHEVGRRGRRTAHQGKGREKDKRSEGHDVASDRSMRLEPSPS